MMHPLVFYIGKKNKPTFTVWYLRANAYLCTDIN